MQYKISQDWNKLSKEQKADFKEKLFNIIIKDLTVEFLTDKVWNDEQFLERFGTSDRHHVYANNIDYYKNNAKILEWIERYGDQSEELLKEYNVTLPKVHNYTYTVEEYGQNYDIRYDLIYCSSSYEDSLSELKNVVEGHAILVGWYKGYPQFVQWIHDGEVSEKEDYTDENSCMTGAQRLPYKHELHN